MDAKTTAWRYLQGLRETVLWKVEGLGERDQRMPLTPTGTNLLGVVKHLAGVEAEYFGACLGRPWPEPMAFWADDAEPNADMWATADESPAEVLDLYRRVTAFADETIEPLPLDAPASVPWWRTPDTDLHTLLVHMAVETARHAGQLDILREQLDGARGLREGVHQPPRRRRGVVGRLRREAARHRRAVARQGWGVRRLSRPCTAQYFLKVVLAFLCLQAGAGHEGAMRPIRDHLITTRASGRRLPTVRVVGLLSLVLLLIGATVPAGRPRPRPHPFGPPDITRSGPVTCRVG